MTSFYRNCLSYLHDRVKATNNDIVRKKFSLNNFNGYLYYCSSIIDEQLILNIREFIIQSLRNDLFKENILLDSKQLNNKEEVLNSIYNGQVILLIDNVDYALIFNVCRYPSRGISEPTIEKSVRGSKDAFNENLINNIGLIRKRIKSDLLIVESFSIGEISKTNICLMYINCLTDINLVNEIKSKIKNIDINSLIMTDKALEELILKQKYNPFPLARYTERPDIASISLMKNKVVLLVENSCSALILPCTLFDHTKHVEEFRLNPIIGTFSRLLRTLCILISFFLIPTWFAILSPTPFNNGVQSFMTISLNLFLLFQVLVIEFVFDVIRMSAIHIPNVLVSTIGLISAIILSEVSIQLEFLKKEVLLLCAIEGLCGFVTPSFELSLTNKYIKYFFIIIVFMFGKYGYIIFITALFLYLYSIKKIGKPYLYPLCPFIEME